MKSKINYNSAKAHFLRITTDVENTIDKETGDENARKEAIRIKQLVSVISNMKPAKAAELLSVQDAKISVKIIGNPLQIY